MSKTILIVLSLVLFLALGLFYMQGKEENKIKVSIEKKVPDISPKMQKKEKPTPKINQKMKIEPIIEQKVLSTTDQKNNDTHTLLYEPLTIEEAQLSTPPRKKVTPIGAIQITQNMSQLKPNDTLTLSDVEGSDYTLTVQSIHTNNDGSTSTTANYQDEGITYTTTITQSDKSTYITLSTANGLYEIETSANTGYIYKTIDIRQQLQSRTPNDVIILPIPQTTSSQ